MDDLISRAAARDIIVDMRGLCRNDVLCDAMKKINAISSVDAVPVVRCRDCKFYYSVNEECGCNGGYHSEDWYCANGERRDSNGTDA